MTTKLSDTQIAVLSHAIESNGIVEWLPQSAMRSSLIRTMIIDGLFHRGLIERNPHRRERQLRVTDAGYAALGREKPTATDMTDGQNATHGEPMAATPRERRTRENSKQAQVIKMLEQGATVAEICDATGWQKHTVRGFFAGALKKQGIAIESAKTDAGRVYFIRHAATS